ncbi:MAG: hypothetical protein KME27_04340 [Lyngbya sp. HA4199-MV5]|jgi:prophage DNA circulation protein|nr:hypothetical protein [Lyngbya sp. HA4199-MV5]
MNYATNLRKIATVLLLAAALCIGTAFSYVTQSALADKTNDTNEISNVKGDSSDVNRSYHNLQEAAHEFRDDFRADVTSGRRSPTNESANSPKQAAKNVGKNTRNAFERATDPVKDTLDPG